MAVFGAIPSSSHLANAGGATAANLLPAWPSVSGMVPYPTGQLLSVPSLPPMPKQQSAYAAAVLALVPILYLRLGESVGTDALDEIGRNPGVYTGGVSLGQTGLLPGDPTATSILLNGTNAYINVLAALLTAPADVFSYLFWIATASPPISTGRVFDRNTSGDFQVFVNGTTDNFVDLEAQADGVLGETSSTLGLLGAAHMIALTKNGASIHLYQDAVDVSSAISNFTITGASGSLVIGAHRNGGSDFLHAYLQDVALFNTELSAGNIAALYALGAPSVAGANAFPYIGGGYYDVEG